MVFDLSVLNKVPQNSENKPWSLFLFEGLIFGRALSMEEKLHLKIDWAGFIVGRKFTVFALFSFLFEGNFLVQAPPPPPPGGAYIWRGLF